MNACKLRGVLRAKSYQPVFRDIRRFDTSPSDSALSSERVARATMGGPNLEIFKFGLYIMFPIGWMYYFGTNLEERFNIPDFWPAPETTHKIPFDRDEIQAEAVRLRAKRLAKRARRLGAEGEVEATGEKQQLVVDKKEESRWSLDRGAWELGRH